ncbi:hypothetical protein ONE63_002793 [Megalurothrips usitatus]|uniref:Uncharacterized protein n=1 Tax=Megalurothrips usitatus TaxID=439358 RepID=A0AAV7XBY2_9NEOP|nr:hypothetical protein ONE63_002793 [Megalurothrips usitatus]
MMGGLGEYAISVAMFSPEFAQALFLVLCRLAGRSFAMSRQIVEDLPRSGSAGRQSRHGRQGRLEAVYVAYLLSVEGCRDLIRVLGPTIAVITMQGRVEILFNLYTFVAASRFDANVRDKGVQLKRPIQAMAHILAVSVYATRTRSQARAVLRSLVKLDPTEWSEAEQATTDAVIQLVETNQVEFNAWQIMELDMQLVVSVAGWTVSQLVVLAQAAQPDSSRR